VNTPQKNETTATTPATNGHHDPGAAPQITRSRCGQCLPPDGKDTVDARPATAAAPSRCDGYCGGNRPPKCLSSSIAEALPAVTYPPYPPGAKFLYSRSSSPIRDSWPGGPLVQRMHTVLSGAPHTGQKPWGTSPWTILGFSLAGLLGGVSLSLLAASAQGILWLLLVPAWVLTLYGLRNMALSVFHEAAHGAFSPGHPWLNDLVGELASVLIVGQNFRAYRQEHVDEHHSKAHMTRRDPTVSFLFDLLGLRPGMTKRALWQRFLGQLVSPAFHLRLLHSRLAGYFAGASWLHRGLSVLYLAALAALTGLAPLPMLVAWGVPLVLLVNVALAVRAVTEHVFTGAAAKGRDRIALSTHAQRFGCPAPSAEVLAQSRCPALLWAKWGVAMLGHAISRMCFTPGESPQHDWHHRRVLDVTWPSATFSRQRAVAEWEAAQVRGAQTWLPYTEVWGILNAANECFRTLSATDPAVYGFAATKSP
jgi:hypothetical protein